MANKESTNVTGLESSTNFEQDEKSLVKALLEAADYKTGNEDSIKKIFVKKQSGETLFSFRIRGLSQSEIQAAAKKATKQIPNPAGPKYPKISGERSTTEYHNNLIYTATVDEDKQRIWGNNDIDCHIICPQVHCGPPLQCRLSRHHPHGRHLALFPHKAEIQYL